jgi:hypothetical protein
MNEKFRKIGVYVIGSSIFVVGLMNFPKELGVAIVCMGFGALIVLNEAN